MSKDKEAKITVTKGELKGKECDDDECLKVPYHIRAPKGDQKKKRGTMEAKNHWEKVEHYCETLGAMAPECIDAWYAALDRENWLEWAISIKEWFNTQPFIALFGGWFGMLAWWYSFDLFIWPNKMPSIKDAPWEDIGFWRAVEIVGMTGTADLVKPDWFFISQFFTLGDSDLSDLELIYMTPMEGVVYFLFEGLYLPWIAWLPACLFVTIFWWLYAAEFVWMVFDIFIFILQGGVEQYEEEAEIYYTQNEAIREDSIPQIVDETFEDFDTNGDGYLDKDESKKFIDYVITKIFQEEDLDGEMTNFDREKFNEDVYNDLWASYDKNKDGQLDKKEMTPYIYLLLQKGYVYIESVNNAEEDSSYEKFD